MGADIHLYAEKWTGSWLAEKWTGGWELASGMEKNEWYDPKDDDSDEYFLMEIDVGRNYDLFALLADVRNRINIEPISPPKGLPLDVCPELKAEYISWGNDAHSASWYNAEQLFNYDWDKIIQKKAVVDARVAKLFHNNPLGFPSEDWPEEVSMSYALAMDDGVEVQWRERLGVLCRWELLKSEIKKLGDIENIRLVFWFDN